MSTCSCTLVATDISCGRGRELQWRIALTQDLLRDKKYRSYGRTKQDVLSEIKTYEKAYKDHVNGK
jgi:hypothetical protein